MLAALSTPGRPRPGARGVCGRGLVAHCTDYASTSFRFEWLSTALLDTPSTALRHRMLVGVATRPHPPGFAAPAWEAQPHTGTPQHGRGVPDTRRAREGPRLTGHLLTKFSIAALRSLSGLGRIGRLARGAGVGLRHMEGSGQDMVEAVTRWQARSALRSLCGRRLDQARHRRSRTTGWQACRPPGGYRRSCGRG
jgi:hypothetical protein